MDWSTTMSNHGFTNAGSEPFAPLENLVLQARAEGKPVSRVSITVGASEEYGALKVSATVSLECPQHEACINLAGETAFQKARELVNDVASHIGVQPLP